MKRFEDLTVGDFSGMTTEQIADYLERMPFQWTRQRIFERAAEMAREIMNENDTD